MFRRTNEFDTCIIRSNESLFRMETFITIIDYYVLCLVWIL
jgi:hypothetical protein